MFFRGYFSQGDQKYFIEPLSPTNQDGQKHALFSYDPEEKTNSTCGTDDILRAHGSRQSMVLPATSLAVCILSYFICSAFMYPVLAVLGSSISSYN